jgi:hypothetical protein
MLFEVPALIVRTNISELIGTIAYVLSFLLFESLVLTMLITIIGIVLPVRFFREKIVAQGTALVFITAAWGMTIQPQGVIVRNWYAIPYIIALTIAYSLIHRYEKLEQFINRLTSALVVLSYTFILLDIIALIIVLIRIIR